MTHPSLVAWLEKQPEWARDALRRHAQAPNFELGSEDKSQVMKRVRLAAGIAADQECDHVPFAAHHLKAGATEGPPTLLVSVGPVKNLARLAPDQRLSFALDGITLIYGDNGTGKSGYCRITKKLCRSLTTDDLLGDVFKEGDKAPAEVAISYLRDGASGPDTKEWKDGTAPPAAIANISVFDSRNARLYVDAENRIGYLPQEVALLEQHAKHCGVMDGQIEDELKKLNVRLKVPLPAGYTPDGSISTLFLRLAPKKALPTADEIRFAGKWTDKEEKELDGLERLLAQDPKVLANRLRRAASVLRAYLSDAKAIEVGLCEERATEFSKLVDEAKSTADAAAFAASERFKDEPLAGAGLPPWRLMYDYAEKYIQSLGAEQKALPASEGDPCALCQQPLSDDAAKRMQRFAEFVNDQASKAADAARTILQFETTALKDLVIPKRKDIEHALADYRQLNDETENLAATVVDYFAKAEMRRNGWVSAVQTRDFQTVTAFPEPISKKLEDEATSLEGEAGEHEKAASTDNAKRVVDRERLAQLKDQKKLSEDLETVLARLVDLEMEAKLTKCRSLLNTQSVSKQVTTLRRTLVTADLEKRIADEIEFLDLTHLPFRVSDHSAGGQSKFKVVLDTPVDVANDKVLSEGEQGALALACFFGELGGDTTKHGLVIDDPVSSLDHIRIRRVARRLVAEAAKGKQVVVFTHNLLFFNEVAEAAAQASPPIPVAKRIVTKSAEAGFGLISEKDEPWIAQKVNDRVMRLRERLKKLESHTNVDTEEYRSLVKDFYTDLRETWERLVEEVLLGKVVERFNTDVRTQSLKGVIVEDGDYAKIYWAMKRASERSGHDMAAGRNLPAPKPDEMKTDLNELDTYRATIKKRSNEAQDRRSELEKAPRAQTL
jgi:hypothetical protein